MFEEKEMTWTPIQTMLGVGVVATAVIWSIRTLNQIEAEIDSAFHGNPDVVREGTDNVREDPEVVREDAPQSPRPKKYDYIPLDPKKYDYIPLDPIFSDQGEGQKETFTFF